MYLEQRVEVRVQERVLRGPDLARDWHLDHHRRAQPFRPEAGGLFVFGVYLYFLGFGIWGLGLGLMA